MTKTKNKTRISFIGNNAEDVTGSSTLIEFGEYKILLEYGLYQSNNIKDSYRVNTRRFDFKPSEIDYIFLNHLHIDHSGLIPRLYKNGCKAKIIAPKGNKELYRILCLDSAFIISKDVELLNNKYGITADEIYTASDVDESIRYFDEYEFGDKVELNNSLSFRFVPSGHIINSAQLELWITNNNHTAKVLYTSDLGNISIPKYYSNKFEPVTHANVVIGECTYGDASRSSTTKDRAKDLEKIKSIVETVCIENKGKVLIPVFSMDRTQNILTHLYDLFGKDESFNIPILIDSPLSIRVTNLYPSLLDDESRDKLESATNWENVKFVNEYADSKSWQTRKDPMIVLAASGFMVAGRSRSWARCLLPNQKNHILFVGYASPDSLAGKIKNRSSQKTITIDGKPIPNKCGITSLLSFTSHIQHDDMLKYYSDINCEKVCLVHGDMKSKIKFGKELQEEISNKSKTSRVVIVNKGTEILL